MSELFLDTKVRNIIIGDKEFSCGRLIKKDRAAGKDNIRYWLSENLNTPSFVLHTIKDEDGNKVNKIIGWEKHVLHCHDDYDGMPELGILLEINGEYVLSDGKNKKTTKQLIEDNVLLSNDNPIEFRRRFVKKINLQYYDNKPYQSPGLNNEEIIQKRMKIIILSQELKNTKTLNYDFPRNDDMDFFMNVAINRPVREVYEDLFFLTKKDIEEIKIIKNNFDIRCRPVSFSISEKKDGFILETHGLSDKVPLKVYGQINIPRNLHSILMDMAEKINLCKHLNKRSEPEINGEFSFIYQNKEYKISSDDMQNLLIHIDSDEYVFSPENSNEAIMELGNGLYNNDDINEIFIKKAGKNPAFK